MRVVLAGGGGGVSGGVSLSVGEECAALDLDAGRVLFTPVYTLFKFCLHPVWPSADRGYRRPHGGEDVPHSRVCPRWAGDEREGGCSPGFALLCYSRWQYIRVGVTL